MDVPKMLREYGAFYELTQQLTTRHKKHYSRDYIGLSLRCVWLIANSGFARDSTCDGCKSDAKTRILPLN